MGPSSIICHHGLKDVVGGKHPATQAYTALGRMVRNDLLEKNEVNKTYRLAPKGRAEMQSGSPKGEPVRSEGSHPSLNGSKPLNEVLL